MHTEEQMKKIWCPAARVPWRMFDDDGVEMAPFAANRGELDGRDISSGRESFTPCIASQCAWWRWEWNKAEYRTGQSRGYCGIAGRPE